MTHCSKGHEYTPENTRTFKRGGMVRRLCKTCQRGYNAKYRSKSPQTLAKAKAAEIERERDDLAHRLKLLGEVYDRTLARQLTATAERDKLAALLEAYLFAEEIDDPDIRSAELAVCRQQVTEALISTAKTKGGS